MIGDRSLIAVCRDDVSERTLVTIFNVLEAVSAPSLIGLPIRELRPFPGAYDIRGDPYRPSVITFLGITPDHDRICRVQVDSLNLGKSPVGDTHGQQLATIETYVATTPFIQCDFHPDHPIAQHNGRIRSLHSHCASFGSQWAVSSLVPDSMANIPSPLVLSSVDDETCHHRGLRIHDLEVSNNLIVETLEWDDISGRLCVAGAHPSPLIILEF